MAMSRNAEQNQRMRDERREQILASAARLFATRGLAATRIADIAESVGMSQGLLYHYFDSKEAIYVEIIRRAFDKMNSAARELEAARLSPRQKLELAAAQLLASLDHSDEFAWYSTLISQASVSDAVPDEARQIIARQRNVPYDVVARIMRAGQKDGSVREHRAEDMALVFWTAIKGLALHRAACGQAFKAPDPRVLTSIFLHEA
jgi:TetR/AcrR family transcriptional regulator